MSTATHTTATRPGTAAQWLRRLGASLALATVLLSSGLHTLAIQTYGWARMYEAYRETFSPNASLQLTFSGNDLCGFCVITQDTLDALDTNLRLANSDQHIPLALPSDRASALPTPPASTGPPPGLASDTYEEIKTEFDPPPPRSA